MQSPIRTFVVASVAATAFASTADAGIAITSGQQSGSIASGDFSDRFDVDQAIDLDRDLSGGAGFGSINLNVSNRFSVDAFSTSFDGSYTSPESETGFFAGVTVNFAVESAVDFVFKLPESATLSLLNEANSGLITAFLQMGSQPIFDVLDDGTLTSTVGDTLPVGLLVTPASGSLFDEDAGTIAGTLQPGSYSYVTQLFLTDTGSDAQNDVALAVLRELDFSLSFSDVEDDDLPDMHDDDDDNGGIGGDGPGGDGGATVVPIPASAFGGLAALGLAGFGYLLKR